MRTWTRENVGVRGESGFGSLDLRADMAAFLLAKRMGNDLSRPVDDLVREMLVAIEDDPGWLAKWFFIERFNSSNVSLVSAAKATFTAVWSLPNNLGREAFLEERAPGANAPTLNPSASVRSVELTNFAQGFADAIENATKWTVR